MTEHKYADILRAIADGKQIQVAYRASDGDWENIDPSAILHNLSCDDAAHSKYRIKPENQIPVRPKPPAPKQHYHQFDTLKLMEHWASPQERRGFLRFNIIKYMERYLNKGGVDDLRKAQKYLSLLILHEASHGQPE